jgi:hypothetical protein
MSPIDSQGHRLEHAAATQFLAMQAAMLHDLGRTIGVAPGDDSAFRTIAQQQVDYDLYLHGGNVASAPGLSNHGWGRAVDITGYEVHDDVWNWLLTHAGEYGYSHVTGAASGERWHWESTNTPSATAIAGDGNSIPVTPKEFQVDTIFKTSTNPTLFLYSANDGSVRSLTNQEWTLLSSKKDVEVITVAQDVASSLVNGHLKTRFAS